MSSLFGVMFDSITGTGSHKKKSHSSNRNSHHRDFEKIQYKMKEAAFKNKQDYEEAQTRAWIRGWKK